MKIYDEIKAKMDERDLERKKKEEMLENRKD